MTPNPKERINPAVNYEKFLAEMYTLYKHDNGADLEENNVVEVPEAFGIIRFRSKNEFKYYDPKNIKFWMRGKKVSKKALKKSDTSVADLPPDPVSDEVFQRIQQRVCTKPSHKSLLEESIHRCELPEEEHEKNAEDIPTFDDPEVFEQEFHSLCKAFKKLCRGNEELSAEEVDEEDEVDRVSDGPQNLLENLNQSVVDETVLDTTLVPEISNFNPRKSSTFLIPNSGAEATENSESANESATMINCENSRSDAAECDTTVANVSTVLVIRVSCEDSESQVAEDSDSSDSNSDTQHTLLAPATEQGTTPRGNSRSSESPKQHPPLHLLTPLQRRLVKLNLY